MPNPYFQFKEFTVYHDKSAMKVTTDSCLFGAWAAEKIRAEKKIQTIQNPRDIAIRVLDIGTGSGLLSLMIAQKNDVQIDAVEIDPDAALQACENMNASPWKKKICVSPKNILDLIVASPYDYIISNPPFYENELKSPHQKKNAAHHSEALNLKDLLNFISQNLSAEGMFFLLLPYKRQDETASIFRQYELFLKAEMMVRQTPAHQPFRMMIMGSKKQGEIIEETISIRKNQHEYSDEFIALLKDYYLHL